MSTPSTNLAVIPPAPNPEAERFLPVMAVLQAIQRRDAVVGFTKSIMREGKDFGTIPGVDRPSLLKPGAEKLCSFFGLAPQFEVVEKIEIWEGDELLFYFWYKCKLFRNGILIAEGDGSCNSRESKYRYRWVAEDQIPKHLNKALLLSRAGRISEFDFAIERAETSGKYGKPAAYWQAFRDAIKTGKAVRIQRKTARGMSPGWEIDSTVYRVPNPDIADQINTIQKMSQKRALVAAVLVACNASEFFTQDEEDQDEQPDDAPEPPLPPQNFDGPPPANDAPPPAPSQKPQMTLDQVLATFTSTKVIESAFQQMKEHFSRFYTEDVYDQILLESGLGPGEDRTVGKAKRAFTALWQSLHKAMEEQAQREKEPAE